MRRLDVGSGESCICKTALGIRFQRMQRADEGVAPQKRKIAAPLRTIRTDRLGARPVVAPRNREPGNHGSAAVREKPDPGGVGPLCLRARGWERPRAAREFESERPCRVASSASPRSQAQARPGRRVLLRDCVNPCQSFRFSRTGSCPERSIRKAPGISRWQFPARSNQLQPCSWQILAILGDT